MSNYESLPLGELGKIVTGNTPKTENPENFGADYMFIGPTDLHKHFFITSSERMISAKGLESIKGSTLNGVSVLVGCIGWDMGNVGVVEGKCATNQQINSITNIHGKYNPLYIYYWLKTKKDFLYQQASVTRTPILNKTDFSSIKINLPKERKYQDKVVGLLAAIDNKIELNNRINAELEVMAKTVYDYWFVQFDFPDANGKPYKTSGGKMIYNPTLKREIPEGWEVVPVGDYANVKKGTLITEKDANQHGNIKVVSAGLNYSYLHDEANYSANVITISASGASAGFINFWREPIFACDCTVVKGNSDEETIYLLNFLKMRQEFIYQQARGSAQPHVYPKDISALNIEVPPKGLLEKFKAHVLDGNSEISNRLLQNQKLAVLRDWLLPMLMNGQVTVK